MKKQIISRCPWCGHEIKDPWMNITSVKKCRLCEHEYIYSDCEFGEENKIRNIRIIMLILSVVFMYFIVYSQVFMYLAVAALSIAQYLINPSQINNKRYNDTDIFTYKRYSADITFTEELRKKQKKLYLSNCNIIPVCFVNDENIPVSHTICIYIENAAVISENKFECTFSFLPLSEVKFNIEDFGIRFYLFDDKRKIAEGVVTGKKDAF